MDINKRLGPGIAAIYLAAILMAFMSLERLILLWMNWSMVPHGIFPLLKTLLTGIRFDAFIAGCCVVLWPIATVIFTERWLQRKGIRFLWSLLTGIFLFFFFFISVVEIAFFDEFNARFNYIAVDYLIYPTEVAGNIWQSYHVVWIVLGVVVLTALVYAWIRSRLRNLAAFPVPFMKRARFLAGYIGILLAFWLSLGISSLKISENRVQNEIAANGIYTFFYSVYSNDLDFYQYYLTMDQNEALRRVKSLLSDNQARFTGGSHVPLKREVRENGRFETGSVNIVIVVVESFGANFTKVLGGNNENITPCFESLARDGILFTNFYATGNRTERALEAIFCGFPPIPGESIIKRNKSENVFTLAKVLGYKGYERLFVYGGRGLFDNMRDFMLTNGFGRFIEQKDFSQPTFSTIWGVCDEDIFHKAIAEFDALDRKGKPFLGTVLTVSNHKPYTYPAGRIDLDPEQRRRENAVKYSDWAIGDFFARAKKYPFFNKTIFVIIGDHGARVYGAASIPIDSYRVPFLIYAPKLLAPRQVDTLGSSLDVAPTLLGLMHITYESIFFGRNLFTLPAGQGYALLQHNRDIGLLRGDSLAVLGTLQSSEVDHFDRKTREFTRMRSLSGADKDLLKDEVAIYQTAYDLYNNRKYHLEP